jgi:protein subunit release factor B
MSELLFSVTASDCQFDYFRGSGKGGQKRNKTSSGVRCTHIESGAVGVSDETRSQHQNKQIAFNKMSQTEEFKRWHKKKVAQVTGLQQQIEDAVDKAMAPINISIELKENNKWVKK